MSQGQEEMAKQFVCIMCCINTFLITLDDNVSEDNRIESLVPLMLAYCTMYVYILLYIFHNLLS